MANQVRGLEHCGEPSQGNKRMREERTSDERTSEKKTKKEISRLIKKVERV